jgi:lipopolysaccharide/colanic/teichoic acid biosynthesis glycosyltransferase
MGERTRELFILIIGDVICFSLALWLTLLVRYLEWPSKENLEAHFGPFLILSSLWLIIFYIAGLYDKHTVLLKKSLFSRIINTQVANMILAAALFVVIPFGIAPKTNLVIYLLVSTGIITIWRLYLFNSFSPKTLHKALLIADGKEAIELADEVNNNDRYNYSFVRIIDERAALHTPDFEQKLLELIDRENVEIIVANPRGEHIERILPSIFDLAFLKFEFTFLDFYKVYEDTFDRIPLSSLRYDWFITHVSQSQSPIYDFLKRVIDVIGSLLLLAALCILLPFIALAMRIEGRGPVLMTQDRIGRYNQPIKVYKLRTMTENDRGSGSWLSEDEKKENVVTRVGGWLRKSSIDEWPQALNVLRGEMSLIGPRNDTSGLASRSEEVIPYYNIRYFVAPGVTGWAQTHQQYQAGNISPQSLEENQIRLSYDLYYIKNRSFILDIEIALRTFKTLLSRFGITVVVPSKFKYR